MKWHINTTITYISLSWQDNDMYRTFPGPAIWSQNLSFEFLCKSQCRPTLNCEWSVGQTLICWSLNFVRFLFLWVGYLLLLLLHSVQNTAATSACQLLHICTTHSYTHPGTQARTISLPFSPEAGAQSDRAISSALQTSLRGETIPSSAQEQSRGALATRRGTVTSPLHRTVSHIVCPMQLLLPATATPFTLLLFLVELWLENGCN